ncbi:NADP-dependent glyceraldehyde-3-phosphate dehydrogenase [Anaerobacillus alkalidiazotrophicus]|uniref:NADP-dependent glyceraldehyde-3-phosphate dehydrogenase n=1 Tax=Anaerobacillus alkalidiazotrophicus TaxID=472963 RepID=A0A1S2MEW8_9BACI|nr:NADP-dependent glyceraldehyde-3-phosphate dehydrogenase [Anaerobacillus alkalidiazotrophicus]OIJ22235.1 NADP-dependent glyceraldehyde-3-phosphate dehydrogenase [Anaerobacillus alkalidiazotrophicus]
MKATEDLKYQFLINNEWSKSTTDKWVNIFAPETNELVGSVPAMSQEEVDKAVRLAKEAQVKWADTPVHERSNLLYRWADKLEERKNEIGAMIALEVGKSPSSAVGEVVRTAEIIRYTAEEGVRIHGELMKGDSFPGGSKNKLALIQKEPLGVVLAISPFNYPVNLAAAKVAPALIAGNTVVFKPATQGAISGILMVEALVDAGLPESVVNVVTGRGADIGDFVVTHPDINMISFTGGTKTGQDIAQKAKMIPLVLELGGKDPAIVLADADLEHAADQIIGGAFSYSGQRCTAIKKVFVIDTIADELVSKLEAKIQKLKVGKASEEATVVPLINEKAADFVEGLIIDAKSKGATIVAGGSRTDNLIAPTLIDHVTDDMVVAWEEQFGPVLPIIRVSSVFEAIELERKSEYGLQASIFTKNVQDAFALVSKLNVGTVQLNGKPERGPDHFPFIGVKNSGLGVQGVGRSIESMMRDKVMVINL